MRSLTKAECARCGEELIAPTSSGYVSAEEIHHFWSCWNCGYMFESLDPMDAETTLAIEHKKSLSRQSARIDGGVLDENRPDRPSY